MDGSTTAFEAGRLLAVLALTFGAAQLSGCAGAHLYRDADAKLARQANDAFKEAKLDSKLDAQRALNQSILARETELERRRQTALRDTRLARVVGGSDAANSWGQYRGMLEVRIADLGDSQSIVIIRNQVEDLSKRLAQRAELVAIAAPTMKISCPLQERPKDLPEDVAALYDAYALGCKNLLDARARLEAAGPGGVLIAELDKQLGEIRSASARLGTEVQTAKREYELAKDAYAQALAAGKQKDDLSPLALDLTKKLDQLGKVTAKIPGNFGGLELDGLKAKIEEQRTSLGAVLKALRENEGDTAVAAPTGVQADLRIVQMLPALAAQAQKLTYPQVSALLLESEHLRLQAEDISRQQFRAEVRLQLLQAKRDAFVSELELLGKAKGFLDRYQTSGCPQAGALADDFRAASMSCRESIARSLLFFAQAWTVGRSQAEVIDYEMVALDQAGVLDQSEIAMAEWNNLIGTPLGQLVKYHDAGVTPQELGNFINAIGLGAIAVGVN